MSSTSPKISPCGLFSSRETLEEALEYSSSLIEAHIPQEAKIVAYTALHVVLNTALAQMEKASLTNLKRRVGIPKSIPPISTISPEDASQLVRDLLIPSLTQVRSLAGDKQEILSIFLLLVSRMFDMDEEAIMEDLHANIMENLTRRGL